MSHWTQLRNSIAASSPQLKGCFVEGTFTTRNLAPNDIKQVVDEVNKISHKAFGEEKDLIGRVYEYFLKEFAVNATKEEGEYYTPHDVVQLIAAMIEPLDGVAGFLLANGALGDSDTLEIRKKLIQNMYGKSPREHRFDVPVAISVYRTGQDKVR